MDSNSLAIAIAAFIAPLVTQLAKKYFGNSEGTDAAFLFFGVSVVIAVVALFLSNGLQFDVSSPEKLAGTVATAIVGVIGLGTVVYNIFKPQLKSLEEPQK